MKTKKSFCTLFAAIFFVVALSPAYAHLSPVSPAYAQEIVYPYWLSHQDYPPLEFSERAVSVLLMEFDNHQILYKKEEEKLRSIASLTKLMTALLVVEAVQRADLALEKRYPLEDGEALSSLGPYDSRMGLQLGDAPSVRELLQGMLVLSGNDAALYAASLVDPSLETFVFRMNRRAEELGLNRTSFADPTGLSAQNVSVAHDLALFASYLISYEAFDFIEYTSQPFFTWNSTRKNTNALVGSYDGTDSLKTGYIEESGFNLIVSSVRNKRRILLVLLGIPAPSIPIGVKRRKDEAERFLDYAYDTFEYVRLPQREEQSKVWGAKKNTLVLETNERTLSLPKNWLDRIESDWKLDTEVLFAPLEKGTKLGDVVFYLQQQGTREQDTREQDTREQGTREQGTREQGTRDYLLQLPLYAQEAAVQANVFKVLWDKIVVSFQY